MQEPVSRNNEAELNEAEFNKPRFNKQLRLLGLAKKAGLLAIGSEAVKAAARSGKVKLVVLASDISEGSRRQARYSAEDSNALCVDTPYTKFDLGSITGRGSPGVIAFLDMGLATEFMKANDKQVRRRRRV